MIRDSAHSWGSRHGVTLVELLVATAIGAILVLSINAVFSNAIHLRDRAYQAEDTQLSRQYAIEIIKRDLANAAAPNGLLIGDMIGGQESMVSQSGAELILFSTSGTLTEGDPWGDIQQIEYTLSSLDCPGAKEGLYLLRGVTRNLLSTVQEEPEYEPLLERISSLIFEYYDGTSWRTCWDSSAEDPALPAAIRVTIVPDNSASTGPPRGPSQSTIQVTVPVVSHAISTEAEESTNSGGAAPSWQDQQADGATGTGSQGADETGGAGR
ncbi:MAG TPA: type II secretion system protein GspJ [bacterium]|nr:type II secretion system protein GspJ [bacterium]HQL62576.1 type II secretion system protein GspJ [bacterium]